MEFPELADDKAPFLSRAEVLKCKYGARLMIVMNCIVSSWLAFRFATRWSHEVVWPAISPSLKEKVFVLVFILVPTPLSLLRAWVVSRRLTPRTEYRAAIFWILQDSMATMTWIGYMVLFLVLTAEF